MEDHPIAVTCGKCGISLKGKAHIDNEKIRLFFEFENAEMIYSKEEIVSDYIVECSAEFTTFKMCNGKVQIERFSTPFIRFQHNMMSDESYKSFMEGLKGIKQTMSKWAQYKRVLQLYENGNEEYLIQEIKKLFPPQITQCRNRLEILRGVRMVEVQGFIVPLKQSLIGMEEIGLGIVKMDKEKTKSFIEYLNSCDGYSLDQIHEQIVDLLSEFVEVFPYIVPAFSLQFCDMNKVDFDIEGTTTSTFEDVKQFYLDVYETLGNLLIIPVALDNIFYRGDFDKFRDNTSGISSLNSFLKANKGNRFQHFNTDEIFMRTIDISYDQKLRNAIGHNDVKYDNPSQIITYIPNPRKREDRESKYLLEFEIEALKMFEAILVISEYLYRLKEIELIKNGECPIPCENLQAIRMKKIYPNEKCPCGSGLKYKKCHGLFR